MAQLPQAPDPILTRWKGILDPVISQANSLIGAGIPVSYTPVINAGTGVLGAYSVTANYTQIGKTVLFSMLIKIISNGTGSQYIGSTLPVPANGLVLGYGREDTSGTMLQSHVDTRVDGLGPMAIFTYNNGYPGFNGALIAINGTYFTL
jgi:hypothetical protein